LRRKTKLSPLRAFADDVYLHQVVESGGRPCGATSICRRRSPTFGRGFRANLALHFHVPVYRESLGPFSGTQRYLRDVLAYLKQTAVSPHLES